MNVHTPNISALGGGECCGTTLQRIVPECTLTPVATPVVKDRSVGVVGHARLPCSSAVQAQACAETSSVRGVGRPACCVRLAAETPAIAGRRRCNCRGAGRVAGSRKKERYGSAVTSGIRAYTSTFSDNTFGVIFNVQLAPVPPASSASNPPPTV